MHLMIQSLESHNTDKINGPSKVNSSCCLLLPCKVKPFYPLKTQVFLILPFHLLESQLWSRISVKILFYIVFFFPHRLFSWSFFHGLFARSFFMVFGLSHGLFSWSLCKIFSHGLFSWSFLMVFSHGLFSWSLLSFYGMVFGHTYSPR